MRVFLTGARGFVGRWLTAELEGSGHVVLGIGDPVDVTDADAVRAVLRAQATDAVVHLAAVSYAGDATHDPARAFDVNVRGTLNVVEAVRLDRPEAVLLVAGSSEVYAEPSAPGHPLREDSPLRPRGAYGLSKAAAEAIALAAAARHGLRTAVTRSFNHIGPGQRDVFVVPALARRIHDVLAGAAHEVRVGNLDVRRDFSDVRDVVRAYRLIVEGLAGGALPAGGLLFNVASGRSVAIREIVDRLGELAGVRPRLRTDPELVRAGEPPEITGDASSLRAATGWRPQIAVADSLADVWRYIASEAPVPIADDQHG